MPNWKVMNRRRRTRAEDEVNMQTCYRIEDRVIADTFSPEDAYAFMQFLGTQAAINIGNIGRNTGFYDIHGQKDITISRRIFPSSPSECWRTLLHELVHARIDQCGWRQFPAHGALFKRGLDSVINLWQDWLDEKAIEQTTNS